jgi:hypothetical protein
MRVIPQLKQIESNYLNYLAKKHKTLQNEADVHLLIEDEKH